MAVEKMGLRLSTAQLGLSLAKPMIFIQLVDLNCGLVHIKLFKDLANKIRILLR